MRAAAPPPVPPAAVFRFFRDKTRAFRRVPVPALQALARAAAVRLYAKGENIFRWLDPAREVCVILEGRLCLHRCSLSGIRTNIEVFAAGDLFGLRSLHSLVQMSEMQALQDTRIAAVPRDAVLRLMERHPELGRELFHVLAERQNFLESQLLLAREPVALRLAAALVYLHHKFGAVLPMTRAEIGEMAGTTSETTMRVFKVFQRKGYLRRSRRRRQVAIADLCALRAELAGSFPEAQDRAP